MSTETSHSNGVAGAIPSENAHETAFGKWRDVCTLFEQQCVDFGIDRAVAAEYVERSTKIVEAAIEAGTPVDMEAMRADGVAMIIGEVQKRLDGAASLLLPGQENGSQGNGATQSMFEKECAEFGLDRAATDAFVKHTEDVVQAAYRNGMTVDVAALRKDAVTMIVTAAQKKLDDMRDRLMTTPIERTAAKPAPRGSFANDPAAAAAEFTKRAAELAKEPSIGSAASGKSAAFAKVLAAMDVEEVEDEPEDEQGGEVEEEDQDEDEDDEGDGEAVDLSSLARESDTDKFARKVNAFYPQVLTAATTMLFQMQWRMSYLKKLSQDEMMAEAEAAAAAAAAPKTNRAGRKGVDKQALASKKEFDRRYKELFDELVRFVSMTLNVCKVITQASVFTYGRLREFFNLQKKGEAKKFLSDLYLIQKNAVFLGVSAVYDGRAADNWGKQLVPPMPYGLAAPDKATPTAAMTLQDFVFAYQQGVQMQFAQNILHVLLDLHSARATPDMQRTIDGLLTDVSYIFAPFNYMDELTKTHTRGSCNSVSILKALAHTILTRANILDHKQGRPAAPAPPVEGEQAAGAAAAAGGASPTPPPTPEMPPQGQAATPPKPMRDILFFIEQVAVKKSKQIS
jgi:hypothetical protein